MIKRIYINNFRCFVDFEIELQSINLFLGDNGSGKSSIFAALKIIQKFINGNDRIEQIFKDRDRTRWLDSNHQDFELDIERSDGIYQYRLSIQHDLDQEKCYVEKEDLFFNDSPLLKFRSGKIEIYDKNKKKFKNTH